jgi:hypothetical protein
MHGDEKFNYLRRLVPRVLVAPASLFPHLLDFFFDASSSAAAAAREEHVARCRDPPSLCSVAIPYVVATLIMSYSLYW